MVRICNVNIPDNKPIYISLSYIYGIGQSLAKKILKTANIDIQKKTKRFDRHRDQSSTRNY